MADDITSTPGTATDETERRSLSDLAAGQPTAMLTSPCPHGLDGRPLTVQRVDDDAVWFLVGDDAPWLDSARGPVNVAFVDDKMWVSVSGMGSTTTDPAVLDDLGDPVSDAWFQEGHEPVALKVEVAHGDWWTSPGALRMAVDVAGAKLTGQEPSGGDRGEVA